MPPICQTIFLARPNREEVIPFTHSCPKVVTLPYKPIVFPGKPVPYVRQTHRSKFLNERAQAYNNYRDAAAMIMRANWRPLESKYALLVVKIYLRPAKSTGEIPQNAGDWDNFYKTFADACQAAKIVNNDSRIVGPGPASRNYLETTKSDNWAEVQLIPIAE